MAFENQDRYDTMDAFRAEVIMRCGYVNRHVNVFGDISEWPKSIAFANMDEIDFALLYKNAIDIIIQYFIAGATPHELEKAVEDILTFS